MAQIDADAGASRVLQDGARGSSIEPKDLIVRAMSKEELGLCYCWLKKDEEIGCEKWFTTCGPAIQACFEDAEKEGALTGLFVTDVRYPVAFAVCKSKPKSVYSIDIMAVRKMWRRRGLGYAIARHFMEQAHVAGEKHYEVDALPGSVEFWKSQGFAFVPGHKRDRKHSDRPMRVDLPRPGMG